MKKLSTILAALFIASPAFAWDFIDENYGPPDNFQVVYDQALYSAKQAEVLNAKVEFINEDLGPEMDLTVSSDQELWASNRSDVNNASFDFAADVVL